ncbi:O-antigen polymerase [Chitinophaga sp. 30R24]|uniref:O-antigen polymerase n=1 Tax=Chitinophaga sp. 30R24 TaxID=3248838 RepID=UPI003B8F9D4D
MNNYDFLELLVSHSGLYLFILLMTGSVYFILLRRIIKTPIDPLFLVIVSTIFGCADVIFMYATNAINIYYFSSFLLTQFAFILGFFSLHSFEHKRIVIASAKRRYPSLELTNINFLVLIGLYVIIQLFVYWKNGIPLFYESRLDYYEGGSGFGIFSRILDVLSLFVCCMLIEWKVMKKLNNVPFLLIWVGGGFFYFLTLILSGSKGSIFTILFIVFAYYYVSANIEQILCIWRKYRMLLIIGGLGIVLVIISIQSIVNKQQDSSSLILLGYRFIASGDIYWYTYPNSVLLTYPASVGGGMLTLFNDFLGLFRLIDWNSFPEYPGVYFYKYHHASDLTQGANMRHNIFGLLYFGYIGSIFYSMLLGILGSFIRFFLPRIQGGGFYFKFICIYFFLKVGVIDADMTLFMTCVDNLALVLPMIFIFNAFINTFFLYSNFNVFKHNNTLLQR